MKHRKQIHESERMESGRLRLSVPGLDAAVAELHAAYPELTGASIEKILGLPTRSGGMQEHAESHDEGTTNP